MRFGRLAEFDERSRKFPIRTLIGEKPRRSYTWSCGIVLDQGNEGACTGFAICHEAAARPVVVKNITNNTGREVYHLAQTLDQWPGRIMKGFSVLGAMKAGEKKGWYKEYRWAFGENDLALAIGYAGPCVIGVNWYESMSDPDGKGRIRISGSIAGGHAIMVNGYNVKTGLYRLHNSWGNGWGVNGECFINQDDMALLLSEDGEAAIPVIRTLK